MVDKVCPLKIEQPGKGTELDFGPTETDPSEDYVAAKGVALRNLDTYLIDDDGSEIQFTDPTNGTKKVSDLLDADQEVFDPTGTDLTSTNTGDAIRELAQNVGQSASPGFSWGRSGNLSTNTWLQNEGVNSNRAGRTVTFTSPEITRIFVATEDPDTYTITIYEHEGDQINLTSLTTLSAVASRTADSGAITVAMTSGRQLAVRITSGSAKNMVVGMTLAGENT